MTLLLNPIATIRSCYPERFGIPRQPGLVPSAYAAIVFPTSESTKLALRGLDQFSHIWVIFLFHNQPFRTFKPLVQPPRLGGKKTMGVYATRSPNRPNPIGLSTVQLTHIEMGKREIQVHITGGDFLDGTPVLDIKPYVPYADAIPHATSAWAAPLTPSLPVTWDPDALASLANHPTLQPLIEETLAQDPRPAYERGKDGSPGQEWHMHISHFDVSWSVTDGIAHITRLRARPG